MCKNCADIVRNEIHIREPDLKCLPFKPAKWFCIVPGCKCHVKIRDYGLSPYYYWPVKRRYPKSGGWRGGWFDHTHPYMCSRHWELYRKRQMERIDRSSKTCISKIVVSDKQSK